MSKRFTDTEKWKKQFFRKLSTPYKLFWIYLTDDCSHSGIWEVEDPQILALRIGETVDLEKAISEFNQGENRVHVFDSGRKWFVIPFVTFQYGDLNQNNRLHEKVRRELESRDLLVLRPVRGPLGGPLEAPKDKEKEEDKEKEGGAGGRASRPRGSAGRPTLEEVKVLFGEKGFPAEAEKFFDYYESNGWRVGKNPMKNWQSAVANWLRNGVSYGKLESGPKKFKKGCSRCGGKGAIPPSGKECWCWRDA